MAAWATITLFLFVLSRVRDQHVLYGQRKSPTDRSRTDTKRRPNSYWNKKANIRNEIQNFWEERGIDVSKEMYIPSETLLIKYKRHDLRNAISSRGGKSSLADQMGAKVIPGKWKDAVKLPIIRQLIEKDNSLSLDRSPLSMVTAGKPMWQHRADRKQKGYWNVARVLTELYEYLEWYKGEYGRPSVWMPRPSELSQYGREDLNEALKRFGGARKICKTGRLIPHSEWKYFEGQLRMMTLLKQYISEHGGDYDTFPKVSSMREQGYGELHALIQYYGGRKFVSSRLSMGSSLDDLDFGPFDLDFGIRLLQFIRDEHMRRMPPLSNPVAIAMPSQKALMRNETEGSWLSERISEYGGYENVARRLGLAY